MSAGRKAAPPPLLSRTTAWTRERIGALPMAEVRQLCANAERLQEPEIAALCAEVLTEQRRAALAAAKAAKAKAGKGPLPKKTAAA